MDHKDWIQDRELSSVSGGTKVIEHITRTEIRCKLCGEIFDYTTVPTETINATCTSDAKTIYNCPGCLRWVTITGEKS